MKWWEIVLCIIGISFCHYVYIEGYRLIFKTKMSNITYKTFITFLLITILTYYNTFYNYGFSKIVISFLEFLVILKDIYKENLKITFIKTIILYLLGWITEMILGVSLVYFTYNSLVQINDDIIIKVLFSILMMLIILLSCNLKFIRKISDNLYNIMNKIFNMTLLIVFSIIVLVILTYYLILSTDVFSIGTIILLIIILFTIIVIAMIQIIKTKKANDKQEILLDFMKEYEMIIDKERIDRHDMVNNLLVLKSFKNRNTKEFEKILDGMLFDYQSNKMPKGLYELPSGLKGLFYYKIYDMKNKNIDVFINISNKIMNDLDSLDSKILAKVCKILGILLDNAKESSAESEHKLVVIDLYKEEKDILIYIENTMKNTNLDLNKIKVKGFSTKGTNRGYGLYLVDKLLNKENKILLHQENKDNKFISILTIKK